MKRKPLTRFAWLSIAAALLTMGLKAYAYQITGSVGLLSDAAESLVNLAAALVAWMVLSVAARPADMEHPFGHGKIEYFASGFEGSLILIAAGGIAWAAWERLQAPVSLQAIDLGLAVSVVAGLVNLMVGMILIRAGRQHASITLEADGRHLLTDVWTTAAILLALLGVLYTGWWWLDPAIALLAAIQIVWSGLHLIRRSVDGLLDTVLPQAEQRRIQDILDDYRRQGIEFHDLRTRQSGMDRFINLHVLVPGGWTVRQGHDLVEEIEQTIASTLTNARVVTHLEPRDDKASFAHETLLD
jgi:cation diffusion facilitator family transporter